MQRHGAATSGSRPESVWRWRWHHIVADLEAACSCSHYKDYGLFYADGTPVLQANGFQATIWFHLICNNCPREAGLRSIIDLGEMENSKRQTQKTKTGPGGPARMTELQVGDRIDDGWGHQGTVTELVGEERVAFLLDGMAEEDWAADITFVSRPPVSLLGEVQVLINILVSTGNDNKRALSRRVAALLAESKGALSRSDKLQAAAMLLVSAGLAADHVAERDDG